MSLGSCSGKILRWSVCPDLIVNLIQGFHVDMKVRVSESGALSDELDVATGVNQGCVMAPVLFNVYKLCVTHILHLEAGGE